MVERNISWIRENLQKRNVYGLPRSNGRNSTIAHNLTCTFTVLIYCSVNLVDDLQFVKTVCSLQMLARKREVFKKLLHCILLPLNVSHTCKGVFCSHGYRLRHQKKTKKWHQIIIKLANKNRSTQSPKDTTRTGRVGCIEQRTCHTIKVALTL